MSAPAGTSRIRTQRRQLNGLLLAIAALFLISAGFFYRQNYTDQLGGPISLVKLLWLDYALTAWVLVPLYFWRSEHVSPGLRSLFGWHLASFAARGLVELWMLYVTHSWIPPYGIAHNLFTMALITLRLRKLGVIAGPEDAAARHWADTIRLGLVFEISFAWLFFRAVNWDTAHRWFASDDPAFAFINGLTWVAVAAGYTDLILTMLWLRKPALKKIPEATGA